MRLIVRESQHAEIAMPNRLPPRIKLAPAEYRCCPQCYTPMLLKQVVSIRTGVKSQKFECRKCRQAEEIVTPVGLLGRLLLAWQTWPRPFARASGAVSAMTGRSPARPGQPTS